ncbi:hypothetical protein ABEB36_014839 [Hypothenemus hampei]|uniref:TIR domain-containing protein n=1 Tax=Hypothenemus hampei TaxID=57062 RepID=A0ABD1E128_HYPHA
MTIWEWIFIIIMAKVHLACINNDFCCAKQNKTNRFSATCSFKGNKLTFIINGHALFMEIFCRTKLNQEVLHFPKFEEDLERIKKLSIMECGSYAPSLLTKVLLRDLTELSLISVKETVTITNETLKDFKNLNRLKIEYSQGHIAKNFMKNNPKLTALTLNHMNLDNIDSMFSTAKELRFLELSVNNITYLSGNSFNNLSNLEMLLLDFNNIQYLNSYMFKDLKNLRILDLHHNYIQNIAQTIDLANNKLAQLNALTFEHNPSLEKLNLRYNELKELPENIFQYCKKLTLLRLGSNKLKELNEHLFINAPSLEQLEVDDNKLTSRSFPEELFKPLRSLKYLDLHLNQIANLNMNMFKNLNDLKLSLAMNEFMEYPDVSQVSLTEMDLSYNYITSLKISTVMNSRCPYKVALLKNKIIHIDFRFETPVESRNFSAFHIILDRNQTTLNCYNYGLIYYNKNESMKSLIEVYPKILQKADVYCPFPTFHCPKFCSCQLRLSYDELYVDCSARNLTEMPLPEIIRNLTNIELLKRIFMEKYALEVQLGQIKLYLNLSGNFLREINWIYSNVTLVDLTNNKVERIENNNIKKLNEIQETMFLLLKNNPWKCTCQAREFQKFMQTHYKKIDVTEVLCQDNHTLIINAILCPGPFYQWKIIQFTLIFLISLSITFALFYRNKIQIQAYLYSKNLCLWLLQQQDLDKNKTYDVFISYSDKDKEFVENILLLELENGSPSYKVCIHIRDWIPGEFISHQIATSVRNSKKTLMVLSKNFVDSVWGRIEFRTAHIEAIKNGDSKVLIVVYGDLEVNHLDDELKCYLRSNTYIKWGEKYFWKKLKYALLYTNVS